MAQRKRTQQNMFMGPAQGVGTRPNGPVQPRQPNQQAPAPNPAPLPPPGQMPGAPPMGPVPQMGGMPQMPPPPQLPPITGEDMIKTQGTFGGAMGGGQDLMELLKQLGMGKGGDGSKVY